MITYSYNPSALEVEEDQEGPQGQSSIWQVEGQSEIMKERKHSTKQKKKKGLGCHSWLFQACVRP